MGNLLPASPISSEEIADWIEYCVLVQPTGLLRVHSIAEESSSLGIDDIALNFARIILTRRATTLGNAYPFLVDDHSIRRKQDSTSSAYISFLLLTRSPSLTPWKTGQVPTGHVEFFEDVTCEALKKLLGPGSKAINFGWPSREGRPQEFHKAVPWLAEKMGVTVGAGYRNPRRKDGGVDVIGWRPFADKKSGFPTYLVQCTVQQDVVRKARDIDLRLWGGWLSLDRDPTSVLAVPRTISALVDWNEISANSIILDRIRLSELLINFSSDEIEKFNIKEIEELNEQLASNSN